MTEDTRYSIRVRPGHPKKCFRRDGILFHEAEPVILDGLSDAIQEELEVEGTWLICEEIPAEEAEVLATDDAEGEADVEGEGDDEVEDDTEAAGTESEEEEPPSDGDDSTTSDSEDEGEDDEESDELEDKLYRELVEQAKDMGVKIKGRPKKEDVIAAIREKQAEESSE